MHPPAEEFRVGVLASGAGTNLQAILDTVHGRDGIVVAAVASNNSEARALERARKAGVEHAVFERGEYRDRGERDLAIADWLKSLGVDLVVLAGYMELVASEFLAKFPNSVINIHPALLPAFPGLHAIEKQLEYGVKVTGVTVHFVDEGVDTGPIILQEAMPVPSSHDPDETLKLLHVVEHRLLPQAIRLIAAGAVRIDDTRTRIVHVEEEDR